MTWEDRRAEFLAGIARPDEEAADLLTLWLEGFRLGLPPDEPAHPLLHRLAIATEEKSRLADVAAILLQRWSDRFWKPISDFEKAAYNLLRLAVDLRDPSRLGELIWSLYRHRIVEGEYITIPLTTVLLEAMIANQRDDEPGARELWERLLSGLQDDYVGGTKEQGERGLAAWAKPERTEEAVAVAVGTTFGTADPGRFIEAVRCVHPGVYRVSARNEAYRCNLAISQEFALTIGSVFEEAVNAFQPATESLVTARSSVVHILVLVLRDVQRLDNPRQMSDISNLFRSYFRILDPWESTDFGRHLLRRLYVIENKWAQDDRLSIVVPEVLTAAQAG
ncbi:MAG: hypothetical protein SFV54_13195 [Bryobacteraceae bacterium]|nr:hypothetical protein [Bryobacteraceae bacterium]